jgi:hypothetical protein
VTDIVWNFSKSRPYSQAQWGAEPKFVLNREVSTRVRFLPPIDRGEAELFQAIKDGRVHPTHIGD